MIRRVCRKFWGHGMAHVLMLCVMLWSGSSVRAEEIPVELEGVGVTEHLGAKIPLEVPFVDEQGQAVTLQRYFTSGKPVILNLVYYTCPMLCTMVLNGMVDGLKDVAYTIGTEYEVVSISIDPRDTPDIAFKKKSNYLKSYGRPGAEPGWHFLTGTEENIRKVADSVGFQYRWDERQEQYAHAATLFVLTPQATISRYLYGIQFASKDLRLALLEASEGKIGSVIEQFILFCYHYDPVGKKYALYATNVMRLGGVLTMLILFSYLGILWRRERRVASSPSVSH